MWVISAIFFLSMGVVCLFSLYALGMAILLSCVFLHTFIKELAAEYGYVDEYEGLSKEDRQECLKEVAAPPEEEDAEVDSGK